MKTLRLFSLFSAFVLCGLSAPLPAQVSITHQSASGSPALATRAAGSATPAVFNVSSYGASGSANTGLCSGQAGSNVLTGCSASNYDAVVGQRIRIVGAGPSTATSKHPIAPITATPTIVQNVKNANSPGPLHTYCYIVSIADPYQGITAPSPEICSNPEPDLSLITAYNDLNVQYSGNPSSPVFLWYVSRDKGPFQLLKATGGIYAAFVRDLNQAFTVPSPALSGAAATLASRGGWPTNVSAADISKNEDLFTTITGGGGGQVTVSDPASSTFANATVYHDDTTAIQNTINAAVAAGGGTVQFASGTYYVEEPLFVVASSLSGTWAFSRDYSTNPSNGQYFFLGIPNGAIGQIHFEGVGAGTVLVQPPDQGVLARLIAVGAYNRPNNVPSTILPIASLDKGSTQLIVSGNQGSNALKAGDDIFLFSGSFGAPTACTTIGQVAQGCHFSELNTVASVSGDGSAVTLTYPASKRYYPDEYGSSFGVIKLPVTPHDVAFEHMTLNTYDPVTSSGQAYDLLFNDIHINGYVNNGPFGDGYKRGVTIENSTWGMGEGDDSYTGVDEYDQYTGVSFINDNVYGKCASQASGSSTQCKISATEGSSQFTFTNNNFYNVSVYFAQTTDDTFTGNTFVDGVLALGLAYGQNLYYNGFLMDDTYISFGPSTNADVEKNTFEIDSSYAAPFILRVGNFTPATIANNVVTYNGVNFTPAIWTYSGTVTGNTVNIPNSPGSNAIVVVPDEVPGGQPSTLSVQSNIVNAPTLNAGVYIPTVGFNDSLPICIEGNTYSGPNNTATRFTNPSGQAVYANTPSEVNLSCQ